MKEKIKKIEPKMILIIMAITIAIFSIFILARINKLNHLIYNECESREYVEWKKGVKVPLTPERIEELENETVEEKRGLLTCKNKGDPFCGIFAEEVIKRNREILEQGYEIKRVPDEERRVKSRKEVGDYENCLKNQKLAAKQRPETYKLLFIGNALIIIIGLLTAFAIKENKI